MPDITSGVSFQKISSGLGRSPFDKAVGNRDKVVAGFTKKINRLSRAVAPDQNVLLSDVWGDEILENVDTVFPGMGGFGPGGGPLS